MVAKTIEGAFGVDWRQNDGSIWRSQLGMFGSSQQDKENKGQIVMKHSL